MPRYNVESGGQWACFSTITDDFVTRFMPREEYEAWRKKEYAGHFIVSLDHANHMTLQDALMQMSLNRSDEEIMKCMRAAGLFAERDDESCAKSGVSIMPETDYKKAVHCHEGPVTDCGNCPLYGTYDCSYILAEQTRVRLEKFGKEEPDHDTL